MKGKEWEAAVSVYESVSESLSWSKKMEMPW